jgi:hypothetical protein
VKIDEDYLRKVILTYQKVWHERLPIFLLAYRESTQKTTGTKHTSMVFRRELHLPCDMLSVAHPDKKQSQLTTWQTLQIRHTSTSEGVC